jgi:hypothetical protein
MQNQLAPRCRVGKLARRTGETASKTGITVHRITIIARRTGKIIPIIITQVMGFTLIAEIVLGMKQ